MFNNMTHLSTDKILLPKNYITGVGIVGVNKSINNSLKGWMSMNNNNKKLDKLIVPSLSN